MAIQMLINHITIELNMVAQITASHRKLNRCDLHICTREVEFEEEDEIKASITLLQDEFVPYELTYHDVIIYVIYLL